MTRSPFYLAPGIRTTRLTRLWLFGSIGLISRLVGGFNLASIKDQGIVEEAAEAKTRLDSVTAAYAQSAGISLSSGSGKLGWHSALVSVQVVVRSYVGQCVCWNVGIGVERGEPTKRVLVRVCRWIIRLGRKM